MQLLILPFACLEFYVIIEITGHFSSWTTWKDFVGDTFKVLEIV